MPKRQPKPPATPPPADWRQAAEERGRLAFEAAVAHPKSNQDPSPRRSVENPAAVSKAEARSRAAFAAETAQPTPTQSPLAWLWKSPKEKRKPQR